MSKPKIDLEELFARYQYASDDYLFTRGETEVLTNRTMSSLERDAWSGNGLLEFVKIGRRCYYTKKTIHQYRTAVRPVRSTTEADQQRTGETTPSRAPLQRLPHKQLVTDTRHTIRGEEA